MNKHLVSIATLFVCASAWAADVSGRWSGSYFGGPIYVIVKQDGSKLSGSGGPNENQQVFSVAEGKVAGDRLTFKIGPLQFDMKATGDDLQGEMTVQGETASLTLTRVEALQRRAQSETKSAATLAFEVASIRPNKSGGSGGVSGRGGSIRPSKGRLAMENVSLWKCITFAYGLAEDKDYALTGPDWIKSERFDINASMPPNTRWEEMRSMMQTLLATRFHLTVHRETKEQSVYALVVGKGGSKLQEVEPGEGRFNMSKGQIRAQKAPLFAFAERLSQFVDRPVLDMTGLKGAFDFTLEWAPESGTGIPEGPGGEAASASAGPSIFTAIQQQLGLRLEARKASVDVMVVDRADRVPVEN